MKKITLSLALLLTVGLAACGGSTKSADSAESDSTATELATDDANAIDAEATSIVEKAMNCTTVEEAQSLVADIKTRVDELVKEGRVEEAKQYYESIRPALAEKYPELATNLDQVSTIIDKVSTATTVTADDVKQTAKEAAESAAESAKAKANETVESAKAKANETVESAKTKANETVQKAKDDANSSVDKAVNSAADKVKSKLKL